MCKFYVFWQVSPVIFFAIRNYEDLHKLRSASDIAEYILILHFEHPDLSNTNLRVFHTSKKSFFFLQAIIECTIMCQYVHVYGNSCEEFLYILLYANKDL